MGTRIGAAMMIVVAAVLMMGFEPAGRLGPGGFAVDYTMATADGALIPLIGD